MSFVHLHCHTEGSLLDGMCRSKDMAKQAANFGMPAVAITDHGVMYNVVQFFENCTSAGVKPIIGCEVYVAPGSRFERDKKAERYYHMLLLAKNEVGYKNLVKLVSKGFLEGFYSKPRVDKELLEQYKEGLIATSACLGGEICNSIMRGELKEARHRASQLKEIYGPENFYIELQDHGLDEQAATNPELVRIARELNLPLVATNDVHYLRTQDANPHEVLLCIQTGHTMNSPKRLKYGPPNFYLRSPEEMGEKFGYVGEALENTLRIADQCNFKFDFTKTHLPDCEVPAGHTHESWLESLCREAIPDRYPKGHTQELEDRLSYELDVIQTKGYSAYFLIVADFVRFARSRGIMSQARGSAAGSLVSYLLGLTVIDPLGYNLLFERFLNRERKSMPDIDLDFADDRRDEVIQYCRDKYGADHVAQIIAFGTMAAKAAVRDSGRALEYPLMEVDKVAKLIPTLPGTKLDDALKNIPELKGLYETDPRVKTLVDTARNVEGLYRHASVHAAGVVITKEPVIEYAPVQRMGEDNIAIQYEMADAEKIGLVKMDFLGLRNLTVVDRCLKLVKNRYDIDVDLKTLPYTDEKAYKLLQQGDSIGVFQFESAGMQKLLRNLKPDRLEDLIGLVALYRPGPLQSGMDTSFVKRKHGIEPISYLHPILEPILNNSYGIFLYQEQIMQTTMAMAGFTAGQAETAMKAMSKKKTDVMEKLKPAFLEGAAERDVPPKIAQDIFDVMYNFASYGFNLNHSAAYAVLSYHTAYLKANFPTEFMATNLSSIVDKKDKLALYINEVRRMQIPLVAPSVNHSEAEFTVEGPSDKASIRMGLEAIKNVSRPCIEVILRARQESGPFADFGDFIKRVCAAEEGQQINKTAIECLIKSGAMDVLPGHRAQFLAALEPAMASAAAVRRERTQGQVSLWGGDSEEEVGSFAIALPTMPEMPKQELLAMERDLLGVYVSNHPLNDAARQLRNATDTLAAELPEKKDREPVMVGGILSNIIIRMTKSNLPMANVTLEDMTGHITVVFFPKSYEKCKEHLEKDRIVLIQGRASVRDQMVQDEDAPATVEVQGEEVTPLIQRQVVHVSRINVRLSVARRNELMVLRQLFSANPGGAPLVFHIESGGRTERILAGMRVGISPKLLEEAQSVAGRVGGNVWVE